MAYRLLIRRIWNTTVKEIHCFSASAAPTSSSFPVITQSTKNGLLFLSASHRITLMSLRRASFNVQDKEDFTERVINSQLPVLIDFHAQWVLQGSYRSGNTVLFLKIFITGHWYYEDKKIAFVCTIHISIGYYTVQLNTVWYWLFFTFQYILV